MSGFFWASVHLGWGIFAVAVFTVLWWLLADLVWRLKSTRIGSLAGMLAIGWMVGVGLIVLGFFLAR